jgi:hypothetical protein
MKKIFLITFIAAFALSSCEKDTLGVSTITTYPTIELKGDVAQTILVGGTYTESGYIAKEGETDITSGVKVEGTVDPTKAGVYTLKYTAINKDGFTLTVRRYVGVITPAAAAMDISGKYKRNAGAGGIATVVKYKTYAGLYINDNPGGIAIITGTNEVFVYMFQTDATKVTVPAQDSSVGEFACTGGVYDASGAKPLYKWTCINSGYGTTVRTFNKQ